MRAIVGCWLVLCLLCCDTVADDWVRFRGPNGQGVSAEKNLPTTWSNTANVAWKTKIPGSGWSSPIVYGDSVFLTATTKEGAACHVIRVNRTDGTISWNREVHQQEIGPKRKENSYASPTPVTDGKRAYAVFSDGTAVAVDFDGERIWKNSDVKFNSLHGLGSSPILADGQLIMPYDGNSTEDQKIGWKVPWENAVVLSIDTETGKTRWKGQRGTSRVGHVTPILIHDGAQVVSACGDRVQGFDTKTGERIWSIYSQGEGVTPSPVVAEGMIITSSGFEDPTIRAIRMGGKGDITETHIAWEQKKGVPVLASLLYVKPYLYTITRDNILHCIEAASGDVVWIRRLKGVHSASPVFADDKIYVTSEDGVTIVIKPGGKYDEVARNDLEERCLASMAVSDGRFFIRTEEHLYCIEPLAGN